MGNIICRSIVYSIPSCSRFIYVLEEVAQLGDEFGSMIEVALMLVMVDKEKEEIVLESTEDQAGGAWFTKCTIYMVMRTGVRIIQLSG